MSIEQGTYQFGICIGTTSEDWERNGKSGTNYRLGISRQLIGQFGETQDIVDAIDINKDDFIKISAQANALRDKPVYIQVIFSAQAGGRNGAFLKARAPKGANLFPFNAEAFEKKNAVVVREAKAG